MKKYTVEDLIEIIHQRDAEIAILKAQLRKAKIENILNENVIDTLIFDEKCDRYGQGV